jgi:hypothetical protein
MSDIIMGQGYTPAEAERGKFAVVNPTTLSAMGLTGSYGRYAVLTYNVAPAAIINLSGTTVNVDVCAIDVSNWDALIAETYTGQPLSADVSVQNWPVLTEGVVVSSISLNLSTILSFNPAITLIELYNNSQNKIYFTYDTATSFEDLTGKGMILAEDSYYSIEKNISNIVLGSASASDIRIFGHRR